MGSFPHNHYPASANRTSDSGDESPVSQTSDLYHLQKLDSQIDATRQRLAEIEAQLSQNEAVRAAQAALAEAEETRQTWRTRQIDLELARAQLKEEAEAIDKRLYSGKVHNPRELTDLQDKLAELRRRLESLEEPLLEAMYGVEDGTAAIEERQAALERVKQEQAQKLGELSQEQDDLSAQLAEQEAEATQIRTGVDAGHLAQYDRLRQRLRGIAIAALKGDECSLCGSQVISRVVQQARHGEVVTCPTCGRILHHP
jgi:predicted  nucleic acid-binding Zn-ribbon protein